MTSEVRFDEAERHKLAIRTGLATAGIGLGWLLKGHAYMQAGLTALFGYLLTGTRYQWIYILKKTFYRDYLGITGLIKTVFTIWWWEKRDETVASIFSAVARAHPHKTAFIMGDVTLTFQQGEELSNRIAWYFKKQGFQRGDAIAIVMESKPEYPFIWMGLAKIGLVSALLNHNLRNESLVYCISVSNCKAIIYGDELSDAIRDIQKNPDLQSIPFFQYNTAGSSLLPNAVLLSSELSDMPTESPTADIKKGHTRDKVLYIYTSGTTGFPKAAIITNVRLLMIPMGLHSLTRMRSTDVVYAPLPLYHTAGGVLGAGQALIMGCTVVMRSKFSAFNYWSDCVKYKCTVAQYIGEICRYLLSTPAGPADRAHSVRLMIGNGLRKQIWQQFVDRFAIKQVAEFYGATEGNSNLINLDSHVGAIGFLTRSAKFVYPLTLVKCDQVTGEIYRNNEGKCIECGPGEPGLFLGKINPKRAILTFSGYADKTASEKKMVRDVCTPGDCYFNTGDILVMDHLGYFYFRDRTGDTFRWRGENVSTCEVEAVIANIVGLTDIVVYGVTVPHTEGRAGMAAIVDPDRKINPSELAKSLKNNLPSYAIPVFLRITTHTPITSTFKLKKRELMEAGFDMAKSQDVYYFLDGKSGDYVPLTNELCSNIVDGKTRL